MCTLALRDLLKEKGLSVLTWVGGGSAVGSLGGSAGKGNSQQKCFQNERDCVFLSVLSLVPISMPGM